MRPVIYLCSFGPAVYSEMAGLCVKSLRRFGRYAGPIIVFTNNGFLGSDNDTQVVAIPDRLSYFETRTFKARASQYIDGAQHTAVMSIDTDMLAIRDINPLLTYRHERACGMREIPWTRMSDRSCNACLRQTERRLARSRWGINGGLLCTPGHLYERYMVAWEAECVNHRHRLQTWVNQPALNALILRRDIQFTAYPRRWIKCRRFIAYGSVILAFSQVRGCSISVGRPRPFHLSKWSQYGQGSNGTTLLFAVASGARDDV